MYLLILAAAVVAAGPPALQTSTKADCYLGPHHATTMKAKPRRLGELPPGKLVLTVLRKDERGCPIPLVVREGIGAAAR